MGNVLNLIREWKSALLALLLIPFLSLGSASQAGTLVRVGTSVGDYTIELLDQVTPRTVQNFLNYVNRGAYNGTYINRSEPSFVVQGGGYRFQSFVGPIDVLSDPPIVNEYKVSNTRGTVAMAKLGGDPNSATTQWFVNVADNSLNLDAQNAGFTVFGTVLGNGMTVVDTINQLLTVNLGSKASAAPYITPSYTSPTEFVYINAVVVDRFSAALHVYEQARGLLMIAVNVSDGQELLRLNLNQIQSSPAAVFKVNRESVIKMRNRLNEMATYNNGVLRIPELEANLGTSVQLVRNVVLRLTDPVNLLFTLESYQP